MNKIAYEVIETSSNGVNEEVNDENAIRFTSNGRLPACKLLISRYPKD